MEKEPDHKEIEMKVEDLKVEKYLESLTEMERLTLEIARKHLGSSFDILKSNGFKS